jgi:PAS domain S-box-containing protein
MLWLSGYLYQASPELASSGKLVMKTNTSFCVMLIGVALLLTGIRKRNIFRKILAGLCATIVMVIGIMTFLEHITSLDFGIDQLLAIEPGGAVGTVSPNRMGIPASLSFSILGAGILLFALGNKKVSMLFAVSTCIIALIPATGYYLDIHNLFNELRLTSIAWQTVVCISISGFALIMILKRDVIPDLLFGKSPSDILFRSLMIWILVIPFILGFLIRYAEHLGFWDANLSFGLLVILLIVLFLMITIRTMRMIDNITHLQKLTSESLQESEDRFRTIAETVPVLICITGIGDSKVMFTNEYNNKVFGLKGDEIIGTQGWDYYWDPEDRRRMLDIFKKDGFVDNFQAKVKKSDGTPFWISTSVRPIVYNGKGAIIGASIDITKSKNFEEELKKSEQLYRAIGESIDYGVWVCEPDGRNIYASDSYLKLVGLTQEQCSNFGWGDVLHPDDAERTLAAWKECVRTGGKWDIEHRYKGVDGKYHPVLARGIPIKDENGKITAWAGINLDISNLKKTEEELLETQKKFLIVLEKINIGTWEWDIRTDKVRIHDRAKKILGIDDNTEINNFQAFEKLLNDEDLFHVNSAIKRAIDEDIPLDTIYRLKSDGRFINSRASLLRDDNGNPSMLSGICFDISEIKKSSEQTFVKLSEELLRSNKDLENFAYVASHDLQEPLRMVSSFTQLLAKQYGEKLDKTAMEYIGFAVSGAKRMYDLLNGLLAYSRINSNAREFTRVNTNNIISIITKNLALVIKERNAKIKVDVLPPIFGDETQLIILFQNLIANAIKFSPQAPEIDIYWKQDMNFKVFSVRDKGIGIEPQYFDRIFLIFQRLLPRDNYDGTGIGLAICKRIVERHGGKIWVESEPGLGSVFSFTVPDVD